MVSFISNLINNIKLNMDITLAIFLAAIITHLSIKTLRPLAIKINLTDIPNKRKTHVGSIPLIGGLAMFIGLTFSLIYLSNDLNQYYYYLFAALIVVITGALDDHQDISVSIRLLFQFFAALIIVTVGGVYIESIGNILSIGDLFLYKWAYFFTVIAIIASINAVNMSDGIHGLAGGSSLITFMGIAFLSINSKVNYETFVISILFCGVLPIFLIKNSRCAV